jgi:flagellar protein FlgJ
VKTGFGNISPAEAAARAAAAKTEKTATATATPKPKAIAVEPKKTTATQAELRGALERAHRVVFGQPASGPMLDVLTAQVSLETGSGTSMYNYNFGGIKGAGPTGKTATLRTKEVLQGKTVEIRDGFRAYDTIDDGAADYIRLLRDRFGAALDAARRGDVDAFAGKLKQAGYYTASEADYARALRALTGASSTSAPAPQRPTGPARAYATAEELMRVSDAVSAQDFTLLGPAPVRKRREEEDDDG